jgi:hypothetical protein
MDQEIVFQIRIHGGQLPCTVHFGINLAVIHAVSRSPNAHLHRVSLPGHPV